MILIYGVSGVSFSFYITLMEPWFPNILLPVGNGKTLFILTHMLAISLAVGIVNIPQAYAFSKCNYSVP